MPVIEYERGKVEVDEEGYLVNFEDWNENIACAIAEKEGVEELTKDRMEIIKFMRDYYLKFKFFPILGSICMHIHQPNECVRKQFIDPLKAWKIAGLSRPIPQVVLYLEGGGGVV